MWDARYAEPGFAYGEGPNDFLMEAATRIPDGPVLCLAEGEGRNAVFLAGRGHEVLAVDYSKVGLDKAQRLAAQRGVSVSVEQADLADYAIEPGRWAGIVSIFCHVPPPIRERLHRAAVQGLRPGGVFLPEAYTPAKLRHGTGGPTALPLL
ncbi:MAG: class I SAM-dependent methyltransferase, partial [Deltaproteobacteria bacterium]|nr:class I SAM-dependent methyltransferase [Deltaproteobacteria bacterium]MBW2530022.1 class I SAM-dependent methyltransferase [Deltaproteobacteria bacterium]